MATETTSGEGIERRSRANPSNVPFSVDFRIKEAREGWLQNQPSDASGVLAARSALRVVPAISLAAGRTGSRATRRTMILRVFRAVAAAWAVSAYPGQREVLRERAREAFSGLGDVKALLPERAAAYAIASHLADESSIPVRASTTIGYALDAADRCGGFETTLDAIETDAHLVDQRFSAVTIANSKLWPKPPAWVLDNWAVLKDRLLAEKENWEIWTEWYEARRAGDVTNTDFELARAMLEDDRWKGGPKAVNERMKALVELSGKLKSEYLSRAAQPVEPRVGPTLRRPYNTNQYNTVPFNSLNQISPTSKPTSAGWVEGSVSEIVSRISSDPVAFERLATNAAKQIGKCLAKFSEKIPNEPEAHAGYEEIKHSLNALKDGFENVAVEIKEGRAANNSQTKTLHFTRAATCARTMADNFIGWMEANSPNTGRVLAHLGLATIITATITYVAGVNPTTTFVIAAGALSGKDIWDVVKLFAKKE
jgi:hypothetical protein